MIIESVQKKVALQKIYKMIESYYLMESVIELRLSVGNFKNYKLKTSDAIESLHLGEVEIDLGRSLVYKKVSDNKYVFGFDLTKCLARKYTFYGFVDGLYRKMIVTFEKSYPFKNGLRLVKKYFPFGSSEDFIPLVAVMDDIIYVVDISEKYLRIVNMSGDHTERMTVNSIFDDEENYKALKREVRLQLNSSSMRSMPSLNPKSILKLSREDEVLILGRVGL